MTGSAGVPPAVNYSLETLLPIPEHKGIRSRGFLPHFDCAEIPQFVTFRLIDSISPDKINSMRTMFKTLPVDEAEQELCNRIEEFLDRGRGKVWLKNPSISCVVEDAILHFSDDRYLLHAWAVMPNHVHILLTPLQDMGFLVLFIR